MLSFEPGRALGQREEIGHRPCLDHRYSRKRSKRIASDGQHVQETHYEPDQVIPIHGHDTTSSTACYIFYVLATHPAILARLRAEHVSVLGPDATETASVIISDPLLLNKVPYTLAVIKETLRMYPAVSSIRAGEPNFSVSDDAGRRFPTDGFLVWANPQPVHRDPAYWKQSDDFLPERWLVEPGDPLYPIKGAWRPFKHGARNCIGQELAILEMKVIMVMTVRLFQIELMYDDLDRSKVIRTVYGQRDTRSSGHS